MTIQDRVPGLVAAVRRRERQSQAGFTMIEIALCLAIIGFALIAIIGSLPIGMGVQKNNREETIINQDAAVWVDAIRNGSMGYQDLTNYVLSITNFWKTYDADLTAAGPLRGSGNPTASGIDWYTRTNSSGGGLILNSGTNIIGLLSTPQLLIANKGIRSNYIVAYVLAMSGAAVEKPPQSNADVMDSAFAYRMIVENAELPVYSMGTNELTAVKNLRANARELRLTFRYPVLPRTTGNGRLTFRTLVGGTVTNDFRQTLYFFHPSLYVQAP